MDTDRLLLLKSEFNLSTPAGNFIQASEFASQSGHVAQVASTRLIYETDTGILWADKDGSGDAFHSVPIVVFEPREAMPSLATSDIFVI